jgi:methionyl-tRNA synthetase
MGFALLLVWATPVKSWTGPVEQEHSFATAQIPVPNQAGPPEDEATAKMKKDMLKMANKQRQADLKRDTEKLLQLATELKKYVDKTNENVMSLEVIKKAEEIEKLARSVKEKMRAN